MLADFYIPRLSNDMKIAVQKNNLVGQILYKFCTVEVVPSIKRRQYIFSILIILISIEIGIFQILERY